ncbi:Demethylmenaquinone methyltransferase [hydrothermal vent metagenome]|uniref:Demethylmenaquinone methyltransferase n=1 Tax=hydrothermal vent metagenome TaxID=652676 RepID=A0A3B1CDG0_9ZZZZ
MCDNIGMNISEAKASAVREMFSAIAYRYDFLNHFLSLGIDITWRKKAVREFADMEGENFLDVACGTGDMSIELVKASHKSARVTGIDFSPEMVKIGQDKMERRGLKDRIDLDIGDALDMRFGDDFFDGSMCAFGVRNFAELATGLKEMARVIKPGGRMVILEFATPTNRFIASLYKFYFTRILPLIGGMVSGKKQAYTYLPDSVYKFPTPKKLAQKMEEAGLCEVRFTRLTFGICAIHTGVKR